MYLTDLVVIKIEMSQPTKTGKHSLGHGPDAVMSELQVAERRQTVKCAAFVFQCPRDVVAAQLSM